MHAQNAEILFAPDRIRITYTDNDDRFGYDSEAVESEHSGAEDEAYTQAHVYDMAIKHGHSHILQWIHETTRFPIYDAIRVATTYGRLDLVEWLIHHPGADGLQNELVHSILLSALSKNHPHILQHFIDNYHDCVQFNGFAAWHYAYLHGNYEWIQIFYRHFQAEIDKGIEQDRQDHENCRYNPYYDSKYSGRIYFAVKRGQWDILDHMLQVYRHSIGDFDLLRLCRYAARKQNIPLLKTLFINYFQTMGRADFFGIYAVSSKTLDVVKWVHETFPIPDENYFRTILLQIVCLEDNSDSMRDIFDWACLTFSSLCNRFTQEIQRVQSMFV
jgi:hypothetical protein